MEEIYNVILKLLVSISLVGLIWLVISLYKALVTEPQRIRSTLNKQGIHGPPSIFLFGNTLEIVKAFNTVTIEHVLNSAPTTHDCTDALYPFLKKWSKTYGDIFMFSLGHKQALLVNQPHLVKEISTCVSPDLGKPSDLQALIGNGILTSNGSVWAHERKIIAPALYLDKVKTMMDLIEDSANKMIKSWRKRIEEHGGILELKIDKDLNAFSGDVLLRACFGSNYAKGEKTFELLKEIKKIQSSKAWSSKILGMRYLPTYQNRKHWALEKDIRKMIIKGVRSREETNYNEKDLLQNMLEGAKRSNLSDTACDQFIVNNCKRIYEAEYETIAAAASWCLMLLASNQEWQKIVHAEILEIRGSKTLNSDILNKMKQLTMVIYESLRLYPPAFLLAREASKDMKFAELHIPKGMNIWISIGALHTDLKIWGPDACTFNPNRFANGIAKSCKYPYVYMPFGFGPHICLGQNFAIAELKILLALVISNFSFTLSPNYVHCPAGMALTKPKNGVVLLLKER